MKHSKPMLHTLFRHLPRLLILAILPVGGIIAAVLIVGSDSDSHGNETVADVYPTPPPVTFIPPTPRPTSPPAAEVAQEGIIGAHLPEVTLTALDGSTIDLHDLEGNIIFLNFWATWCVPCQEEMPALQALEDEQRAAGVRVVGITDPTAGQTEEDIRDFLERYDITFTVGLSADLMLYQRFGVAQIPITYIVDRQGTVRFRHIGELTTEDIAIYLDELQ